MDQYLLMSGSSSSSVSTEMGWFILGRDADLDAVIAVYAGCASTQVRHSFLNMALMGATDGVMDTELKHLSEQRKKIVKWCLENGASYMWCGTQPAGTWVWEKSNDTNRELSMLRGPGEVSKGSFKGLAAGKR